MQFMLALYQDEAIYDGPDGPQLLAAIIAAHTGFAAKLAEAGLIRGGEGLERADTATTLRRTKGKVAVHDGPFAETREQLGGFYIIEADSLDEAMKWARQVPFTGDGAIEIRPCLPPPAEA